MQDFSASQRILALLSTLISCFLSEIPFTSLPQQASEKQAKIVSVVSSGIFVILCCFFPCFTYFLPAICFDAGKYHTLYSILPILFAYGYGIHTFPIVTLLILLVCGLLSAYTGHLCESLRLTDAHLQKEQDAKNEAELMVRKRFKDLIHMQDENITTATLKERNRIAREIHDNVGHMLTRSILQAGALGVLNKDDSLKEPLAELKNSLDLAMNNIRSSVHDLHDESVNLHSTIMSLAENVEDFDVNVRYDIKGDIPKEIKYAFIAITKEAITNAEKYSNGNRVDILLREHPAFYQLSIQDNGQNATINHSSGIGLSNMRERVDALGGILQISTDHGFSINATLMKD